MDFFLVSRGPCNFRQRDVAAAVKAAKAAGCEVERIKFNKDGTFDVVMGKPAATAGEGRGGVNEWD